MLTELETETIEIYDARCGEMVEPGRTRITDAARTLLKALPPDARLIDVGCGYGRIVPALPEMGITRDRYLGIDPSRGQIGLARSSYPDHAFEVCDLYEVGERHPEAFDAFVCTCVLMHVPPERLPEALRSLRACLKPGAVGYVSVLQGDGMFLNQFRQTVYRYDSCTLSRQFREAGLEPLFWVNGQSLVGTVKAM